MKLDRAKTVRPSPSMAVAIAALFVALGGTAWAVATVGPQDIQDDAVRARHIAANSVHSGQIDNEGIFSADVRDGQVASRDIRNATVRGADVADGSLTAAEVANAPSGNDDVNAERLDGKSAGAFASATSEPYNEVGAFKEPAFKNGWENASGGVLSTAGFYKDSQGVVHLKGTLHTLDDAPAAPAFTLPPDYRPTKRLLLPMAVGGSGQTGELLIGTDGGVDPSCSTDFCNVGIDGLTFLAGAG